MVQESIEKEGIKSARTAEEFEQVFQTVEKDLYPNRKKGKEEIVFSNIKPKLSLISLQRIFPTEQSCVDYLEAFI
ncbi:884_t:CDS:2 [Entrophospora sp. SA101]|nr:15393_t:CDS:2 [Entrophospora sp. SA101]CAJ0842153.1 884_t:CDS:2 [Entrophospora sp. SA101]